MRTLDPMFTEARDALAAALGYPPAGITPAIARDILGEAVGDHLPAANTAASDARDNAAAATTSSEPVGGSLHDATVHDAAAQRSDTQNSDAHHGTDDDIVAAASRYLALSALFDLVVQFHRRSPNSCVNNAVTGMRVLCPDNTGRFQVPQTRLRGHSRVDVRDIFGAELKRTGSLDQVAESLRTRPGGITVLAYTWKDIRANGTGTEADDHMVLLVNDSTSVDEPNLVVVDLAASRDRNTDNDYGPEDLRNRRALLNRAVGFDDWRREQEVFINRIPAGQRRFETIEFDRDGNLISGSRVEAPDAENLPTHRQVDVPSAIQDETNAIPAGQPWRDEEMLVRSGPTGAHTNTAGRPHSTSGRIGSRPSEEAARRPSPTAADRLQPHEQLRTDRALGKDVTAGQKQPGTDRGRQGRPANRKSSQDEPSTPAASTPWAAGRQHTFPARTGTAGVTAVDDALDLPVGRRRRSGPDMTYANAYHHDKDGQDWKDSSKPNRDDQPGFDGRRGGRAEDAGQVARTPEGSRLSRLRAWLSWRGELTNGRPRIGPEEVPGSSSRDQQGGRDDGSDSVARTPEGSELSKVRSWLNWIRGLGNGESSNPRVSRILHSTSGLFHAMNYTGMANYFPLMVGSMGGSATLTGVIVSLLHAADFLGDMVSGVFDRHAMRPMLRKLSLYGIVPASLAGVWLFADSVIDGVPGTLGVTVAAALAMNFLGSLIANARLGYGRRLPQESLATSTKMMTLGTSVGKVISQFGWPLINSLSHGLVFGAAALVYGIHRWLVGKLPADTVDKDPLERGFRAAARVVWEDLYHRVLNGLTVAWNFGMAFVTVLTADAIITKGYSGFQEGLLMAAVAVGAVITMNFRDSLDAYRHLRWAHPATMTAWASLGALFLFGIDLNWILLNMVVAGGIQAWANTQRRLYEAKVVPESINNAQSALLGVLYNIGGILGGAVAAAMTAAGIDLTAHASTTALIFGAAGAVSSFAGFVTRDDLHTPDEISGRRVVSAAHAVGDVTDVDLDENNPLWKAKDNRRIIEDKIPADFVELEPVPANYPPDVPDDPVARVAAVLLANKKDGDMAVVWVDDGRNSYRYLLFFSVDTLFVHDSNIKKASPYSAPQIYLYDDWNPGYSRKRFAKNVAKKGSAYVAYLTDRDGVLTALDPRNPADRGEGVAPEQPEKDTGTPAKATDRADGADAGASRPVQPITLPALDFRSATSPWKPEPTNFRAGTPADRTQLNEPQQGAVPRFGRTPWRSLLSTAPTESGSVSPSATPIPLPAPDATAPDSPPRTEQRTAPADDNRSPTVATPWGVTARTGSDPAASVPPPAPGAGEIATDGDASPPPAQPRATNRPAEPDQPAGDNRAEAAARDSEANRADAPAPAQATQPELRPATRSRRPGGTYGVPVLAETFDLHVRRSGRRFGPDMDAAKAFHHDKDGGEWTGGAEPGTPISGNRTSPGKPTEPATPWSGRNDTAAEPNERDRTGPDRTAPVPPLAPAVGEVATDGISGIDPSSPPATPIAPAEPDGGAVEGPRSEITEASIAGAVASIAKLAGWLEEDQGHLSARNEEESANFHQQMHLLDALAANAQAGGVVAELMAPHVPPNQRLTSHPPTRMLHAVNQRVLAGLEPDIAVWYPVEVKGRSADEQGRAAQSEEDLKKMASAYLAAISANRSEIAEFMQRGTQTSSPARARLQLPLRIIATILTGKPLRVFEYAACGGFNSMGHLFQIAFAGDRFGDPEGVTVIGDRWSCPESQVPGVKALLGVRPEILEVKCSDLDPLQAADEGDRFRLAAGFMHTDIGAVRDILNASKDAERAGFPAVEQADALDWLPIQLARDRTGSCTVIWDSMLRRYLSEDDNEKLDDMINDAGARATHDNPLIYGLFEKRGGVETLTIRMFLGDGQTREIHIPTLLPNRTPGADIGHIFTATGVLQRVEVAACIGVEVGLLGRPEGLVDAIDAVQGQLRHLDEQGWRDLADRDLSTLPQWLGAHASLAAEMADARSRGASGDEWQSLYGGRDRLRAELATLLGLPQLRTQWIGAVNEDPVFELRRLGEYTQAPEVQRLVEACSQLLEVEFGADQVAARLGSLTGTRPADPPPVEMPSQAYRELAEEALHKVATEATEAGLDRPEDLRRRGAPAMAISHGWDFWLTDAEKDALIAVHPNKVGGSRGIPPDRLNEANERSLRRLIQRLDARPPGDLSVAERQQLRYATRLWDGLVKADHLARTREGEFEVLLVEFDAATLVSRVALRMTPLGADAVQWWHLRVGPDAGAWPEQLFEPGPARDAMMVFGGRRTSPPLFEMSVGPRGVEGVRLTDDESAREASSAGAALAKWLRQRDWCSEELIATIEFGVAELVQRSQADSTGEILVTAKVKGTDPGRREVVVEVIDNNPASPEVREFPVAQKAAAAGVVRLDDRKGTWLRFGESLIDSLLPPNVPNVQGAEIIGADQVRARGGADAGFECGRKVLRDLDLHPDVAAGFRVENRFAGQLPWPEGLVGAICAHPIYAAAVVGRKADWRAIGLGVQESTSFPRNPGDEGPEQFGRSEESAWMPQVGRASLTRDGVELEKLLRAAKDAVRDAMNTVGPKLIRDDRITVIFNSEPGTFEAHIRTDGLDFTGDPVEIVPGRFGVRDGCIVAVVAIPREEHSGSTGATEKRRTEAARHRAPGGGGHQSRVTGPDEGNARPADGPASPAPDRSADRATPTPDPRRGSDDLNMAPATARGGITVADQVKAVVRSFALNRRSDQISFTRDLWVIRTDAGNNNINITVCDSGGRLYLVRTRIPGVSPRDLRIANEADIHAYMMDWVAAPMLIAESETGDPAYAVYEHIRGATLNDIAPRGDAVPDHVLGDIANTFGDLRRVPRPPWIPGGWPDNPVDQQEIRFKAMQEVYRRNKEKYKHLYEQLGVSEALLEKVRIDTLDDRAPRIRHNDVHRKNVIIPEYTDDGVFIPPDEREAVVIDWELATWGDPLGDLAVHLHKMGYLPGEELDLLTYWQAAEPDAVTTNWRRDLAAYRNFERVNSLVTEAVLYAEQLASGTLAAAQEQELIRKLTDKWYDVQRYVVAEDANVDQPSAHRLSAERILIERTVEAALRHPTNPAAGETDGPDDDDGGGGSVRLPGPEPTNGPAGGAAVVPGPADALPAAPEPGPVPPARNRSAAPEQGPAPPATVGGRGAATPVAPVLGVRRRGDNPWELNAYDPDDETFQTWALDAGPGRNQDGAGAEAGRRQPAPSRGPAGPGFGPPPTSRGSGVPDGRVGEPPAGFAEFHTALCATLAAGVEKPDTQDVLADATTEQVQAALRRLLPDQLKILQLLQSEQSADRIGQELSYSYSWDEVMDLANQAADRVVDMIVLDSPEHKRLTALTRALAAATPWMLQDALDQLGTTQKRIVVGLFSQRESPADMAAALGLEEPTITLVAAGAVGRMAEYLADKRGRIVEPVAAIPAARETGEGGFRRGQRLAEAERKSAAFGRVDGATEMLVDVLCRLEELPHTLRIDLDNNRSPTPSASGAVAPGAAASVPEADLPPEGEAGRSHDAPETRDNPEDRPESESDGADPDPRGGRFEPVEVDDPERLRAVLESTEYVLVQVNGPICDFYAHLSRAELADRLCRRLTDEGFDLPREVVEAQDPMAVLRFVSPLHHLAQIARVAELLTELEVEAARSAEPTPGARALLEALERSGRPLVLVDPISEEAIREYMGRHGLGDLSAKVVGRRVVGMDRAFFQPNSLPLGWALAALNTASASEERGCLVIGNAIAAANSAGLRSIGYAAEPGNAEALARAGAVAVVTDLHRITECVSATDGVGLSPGSPGWALVRAAQGGDEEAFGWLRERYRDTVREFLSDFSAWRLRDNVLLVEDILARTFRRAARDIAALQVGRSGIEGWLCDIAMAIEWEHHEFVAFRKRLHAAFRSAFRADVGYSISDQLDRALAEADELALNGGLGQLSRNHRWVLMLRFRDGRSTADIADWTDLGDDAEVRALERDALRRLAGFLAGRGAEVSAEQPSVRRSRSHRAMTGLVHGNSRPAREHRYFGGESGVVMAPDEGDELLRRSQLPGAIQLSGFHNVSIRVDDFVVRYETPGAAVSTDLQAYKDENKVLAVAGRYVDRIPRVLGEFEGTLLDGRRVKYSVQRYIEGRRPTRDEFARLVRTEVRALRNQLSEMPLSELCAPSVPWPADGDTRGVFLRFVEADEQLFELHKDELAEIFDAVGLLLPGGPMAWSRAAADSLVSRRLELIHADIKDDNTIMDRMGRLTIIDYGNAVPGDPDLEYAIVDHRTMGPILPNNLRSPNRPVYDGFLCDQRVLHDAIKLSLHDLSPGQRRAIHERYRSSLVSFRKRAGLRSTRRPGSLDYDKLMDLMQRHNARLQRDRAGNPPAV
ncbi:DUF2332 family protein [Nocardia rhamnosiphila]|uniref:DUF2332 family protein n=1 Tax=Nocardia rhamnosiphila TaxID=426716 RepID=UPI0034037985